jgi:hypothetical protein
VHRRPQLDRITGPIRRLVPVLAEAIDQVIDFEIAIGELDLIFVFDEANDLAVIRFARIIDGRQRLVPLIEARLGLFDALDEIMQWREGRQYLRLGQHPLVRLRAQLLN